MHDNTTTQYFLKRALLRKEEEEEEKAKEEKMRALSDRIRHNLPLTVAEREAWRRWMGIVPGSSSSSSGKRRKRKKRKKLPKSSSRSSSGCGRPCDRQRRVPAVQENRVYGASDSVHRRRLDIPVVQQRQVRSCGTENCGRSAVAVHRWPSTSLSCCRGSSPWSRLFSRSSRLPSCSSLPGGRCPCCGRLCAENCGNSAVAAHQQGLFYIPVVTQWLSPMVQTVLRTIQISRSPVAAPVMQVAGSSRRAGRRHSCRDTEADPHGLAGQKRFPSCAWTCGRCPYFAGRASLTGAGCEDHSRDPTVAAH